MCVPSLACEPNSVVVPSSAREPYSMFVPSFVLVYSSYDDSEDENIPLLVQLPPDEFFELELSPTPFLPRWVCSTREVVGDLVLGSEPAHR